MPDESLQTYRGNCHCGAFVYEVKLPEIKAYHQCNCSICHKLGYAWLFPGREPLDVVKGSIDGLKAYAFSKGGYAYRFCSGCGTPVMADLPSGHPRGAIGINARALQDLDIWSLDVEPYDGKALPPPYEPPVYKGPEPSAEINDGKTYHGSCHCGAVAVALKLKKPLELWDISDFEERIVECNCSICTRGAYVWVYPPKDNSVILGREHLSYRVFNNRTLRKAFCKHCGVHICNEINPLTDEEVEALSDAARAWRGRLTNIRPITLRTLNDFDCTPLKKVQADGWNASKPVYVSP